MRNFFLIIFFILLLILCILFFWFYRNKTNVHIDENLSLSKPTISRPISQPKLERAVHEVKDGVEHPSHAYRSYSYSTEPTYADTYSYSPESTSAAISDTEPMASAPAAADETTTQPAPGSEAALKYVLFSVTYDSQMIAGETKSLQLRMSPKSAYAKLQKALNEKKIQQSQIKEIEKVKNQYRYVSTYLIAQNDCLKVEKKMPNEDKVYVPNVDETSADQIWQWDLTAPDLPKAKMCYLSLFIRFCLNQNDCLPLQEPDKEFGINIEITPVQKIYKLFIGFGEIAHVVVTIITLLGLLGVGLIFKWWKGKYSSRS